MMPEEIDRKQIYRQFKAADGAYRRGDMDALREALGHPQDFPNCKQPIELGLGTYPLSYAIYWSPIDFIRQLIAARADLKYHDGTGFPALIAAMSTDRPDKHELMRLVILEGADLTWRA